MATTGNAQYGHHYSIRPIKGAERMVTISRMASVHLLGRERINDNYVLTTIIRAGSKEKREQAILCLLPFCDL
jgi:hypothetical protein